MPWACVHWYPMPPRQLVSIPIVLRHDAECMYCTSVQHDSFMPSIHSLFGLPLLFCPSVFPNTTFFTNRLSSFLQMCPNNFGFLSLIICTTFFLMSSLCLISKFVIFCCQCMWRILLWHCISNAITEYVSLPPGPGLTCM